MDAAGGSAALTQGHAPRLPDVDGQGHSCDVAQAAPSYLGTSIQHLEKLPVAQLSPDFAQFEFAFCSEFPDVRSCDPTPPGWEETLQAALFFFPWGRVGKVAWELGVWATASKAAAVEAGGAVPVAAAVGASAGAAAAKAQVEVAGGLPGPAQVAQLLRDAQPVGSALKSDASYRAASFAVNDVAERGTVFRLVGGDGVQRVLIQAPDNMNGKDGRFEWRELDASDVRAWRNDQRSADQTMSDLVKFHIPAEFVLARVLPDSAELVYGYERGWLNDHDVVTIALALYNNGQASEVVEELALLLAYEYSRIPELIENVKETGLSGEGEAADTWLFLAVAWVYEQKQDIRDPYELVEMLYSDFGYPAAIEGFVRFMPPPRGESVGMAALDARWKSYLSGETDRFEARRDIQ
ncbi:DUF2247 family protein [Amycolatopsis sp. WAC 01416]|uniref:DUF2247 family protein n=1 Tax=Amycolatopsis sp. WAC 01416 TaxID=2203196 RepID=UPI0013156A82|nr:DUF2247 family protein [Amycolatopsis sp. WAC 01416]